MQIVDIDCPDAPFDGCATIAIIGNNNLWELYRILVAASEGELTFEQKQLAKNIVEDIKASQRLGNEIKIKVIEKN